MKETMGAAAGGAVRRMAAAMRRKAPAVSRRLVAALLSAALAFGQLLGMAPKVTYAASGYDPRTVTMDGGYISRHALDGQEAYCCNSYLSSPPNGTVVSSWHSGPLMLDYVLYHSQGGAEARWGWEPTRYAVWAIMEGDLSYLTTYGSGEAMPAWFSAQVTEEYNAAKAWADAGGVGPERGCSRVYDPPSGAYQPLCVYEPVLGYIELQKASDGTVPTEGNASYSLEGAEVGVYSDEACTELVDTIVTGADGRGKSVALSPRTYWLREDAAPRGYAVREGAVTVSVTAGATAQAELAETPQSNPLGVVVAKVDSEVGGTAQGDATLGGAEFRVEWYASTEAEGEPARTWVLRTGEDGRATLDEGHLVSGDGLFLDSRGNPTVPLGTVVVTETKAPEGYLLTDTSAHVVRVTPEGSAEPVATYVAPEAPDDVVRGGMSLAKRDLELDGTVPQGDASLDATYTIYNRSAAAVVVGGATFAPGEAVWAGTADPDDGSLATPADLLPYGTYEVRETEPATGYLPDEAWSFAFEVREDGEVYSPGEGQHNSDQVIRGGLDVAKQDRETLRFRPLGGATLEGAELTVYNASGRAVLVGGQLVQPGDACLTLATDADGLAFVASDGLPYGTYVVRETKAPTGYLLNEGWSRTFEVREDGSVALLSSTVDAVPDQVIRGDLRLVKVDGLDMGRLSGVPFAVTSRTTGESHVLVTDANGQIDTSSSWNPHSRRTNANDAAVSADGTVDESALDPDAGVWFTGATDVTTEPDDSLGALPYDTYEVRELRVSANEGLSLVTFEVAVTRHGVAVDGGTVDDNPGPRIGTTLTDGDGEHEALASGPVELVDAVAYENLVPGTEYELTGTLMDAETGEPVTDAEGNPVTAASRLVPALSTGVAQVAFSFDASALAGHGVVAFEQLSLGGEVVATHEDLSDEGQTVRFPEVRTTLTDAATGSHEALASGELTLHDVVSFRNVTPGREYTISGSLVDRETGEAILGADGSPVTAETAIVPTTASGSARVTFTLDASLLAGRTVVAFEELSHEGRAVAIHADLEDEAQSVRLPKVGTTASDAADGDKVLDADEGQTVVDTVAYENLEPGKEYELEGRLMWADTGEAVTGADGKPVAATVALVPEEASGTAEVALPLDGTGMTGRALVVFETLRSDGEVVAAHEDPSDEGQTVRFPTIGTTATDAADGDHSVVAQGKARVTDKVAYDGLVPGTEYAAHGTLMDKASGEELKDAGGKPVTATASFVPNSSKGSATVTFEFDATSLAGHDLVAFEVVTRAGADGGTVTVGTHEDLSDKGQTVRVTRRPAERMPQTGTPGEALAAALIGLGCATAGVTAMVLRRKGDE